MSLASLKARLRDRLRPAADWDGSAPAHRSDFDLNPSAARPERTLRPAAVLIAVVETPDGASVVLTRRAGTLNSHGGQIAFPGGRLEPGETAMDAALREAMEEVALDPAAVEVLGLGDTYETGTGFLVTPVVGWLDRPPTLTADPGEVADIFEVPWDFLMDVANHRRDWLEPEPGERRWFWAMPWRDRYIWGVTAGIVRGLRTRLYGEAPEAVVAEDAA